MLKFFLNSRKSNKRGKTNKNETLVSKVEKEKTDEMEMAAKEIKERKTKEKAKKNGC